MGRPQRPWRVQASPQHLVLKPTAPRPTVIGMENGTPASPMRCLCRVAWATQRRRRWHAINSRAKQPPHCPLVAPGCTRPWREPPTDTVFDVLPTQAQNHRHAKSLASHGRTRTGRGGCDRPGYSPWRRQPFGRRRAGSSLSGPARPQRSSTDAAIVLFVGEPQNCMLCGAIEIASRAAVLRDCAGRRQSAGAGADGQPAKSGCQSSPPSRSLVSASYCPWCAPTAKRWAVVVRRTPSPQGRQVSLQRGKTAEVLQQMTAPLTRANVLAACSSVKHSMWAGGYPLPRQNARRHLSPKACCRLTAASWAEPGRSCKPRCYAG